MSCLVLFAFVTFCLIDLNKITFPFLPPPSSLSPLPPTYHTLIFDDDDDDDNNEAHRVYED